MAETLKTKYDVIVVGTGPGGATVARETAGAGKKVLMLDWGSNEPVKGSKAQGFTYIGMPYKSLYFIDSFLGLVRAITVGGSSIVYYATAWEPPFDYWDKYGIDLRGWAAEIRKEVPIGPLKDELIGPSAKMIAKSALDLGYNWQKIPKFVYQDRCRANCDKCGLGCPYGAKWNSRMFAEDAEGKGAELLDLAHVNRVIIEGGKATGVEFSRKGRKYIASGEKIVVAAGGIGSPIILENSGIPEAGANFFYDPLIAVFGTVKGLDDGCEFPMAMGQHIVEDDYLMTDMTMHWLIYDVFAAEVFRFDKLAAHKNQLTIMIKARDSLGGKISKSGFIKKPFTSIERTKLMSGFERAKKILTNAGAKDIFKTWWIASHPGGTCKINDIVDANLKTRFDNLYVCDCSVIPAEWGRPPVFSILCLGKRLGQHLVGAPAAKREEVRV